jgi:hypothetical protein
MIRWRVFLATWLWGLTVLAFSDFFVFCILYFVLSIDDDFYYFQANHNGKSDKVSGTCLDSDQNDYQEIHQNCYQESDQVTVSVVIIIFSGILIRL